MSKNRKKLCEQGGYNRISEAVNRTFNLLFAFILISLSLPLWIFVIIAIVVFDHRPIFYKGIRLGVNKKPYTMYKFRTLKPGAEELIGQSLWSKQIEEHKNLISPLGFFLRDTRLDELPQLWNVIIGNMDLIGPRPVRKEIYEKFCKDLPGYDRRFQVKPGVIGYSQLFTPHSTPKRIRAYIDNLFMKKKQVLSWDSFFVVYAFGYLFIKMLIKGIKFIYRYLVEVALFHRYQEKRAYERLLIQDSYAVFRFDHPIKAHLIDINEDAVLIEVDHEINLTDKEIPFTLSRIKFLNFGKEKLYLAKCRGEILRKSPSSDGKLRYVIKYKPISKLNEYMIHQYFLSQSIIGV